METISFEIKSNKEVWDIVDKTVDIVLLHKFDPHQIVEWWKTSLTISNDLILDNIQVREMEFDLQTNLAGLKGILNLNSNFLFIYQFTKPISDTLTIQSLPDNSKEEILRQSGLEHIILIEFERVTIKSFKKEFIDSVKNNPLLADRRLNWRKEEM